MTDPLAIRLAELMLSSDPLPAVAREYCGLLLAACAGAAVLGVNEDAPRIVVRYVRDQGAVEKASVIGAGFKTSLENASLANNTLWHSTELEGNSYPEVVSVYTLFGPLLAVGEVHHLPGSALVDAAVLGHELQARLALAANPDPNRPTSHHYMNMQVMGGVATAAVVGRLLGHDVETIAHGLSIAASQAFGIVQQTGSMTHFLESGLAARAGIIASALAEQGFRSNLSIFELPGGLLDISSGGLRVNPNEVVEGWASGGYRILAEGEKLFPSCYLIQHLMQAAQDLRSEYSIDAPLIEEVVVETNAAHASICRYSWPEHREEEAFSIAYGISLALGGDSDPIESFRAGAKRLELEPLMTRVRTVVHPEWVAGSFAQPQSVTVRLTDGRSMTRTVHYPHGHPPDSLSRAELVKKFQRCTALLPESTAAVLESALFGLDNIGDVADIAALLQTQPRNASSSQSQEVAAR